MHNSTSAHQPEHKRTLNVFVLAMLSMAVVISLRNLPLTAEYGLASVFYYIVAAVCFMVPYALIAAELASGWPKAGGVYIWVRTALGERWGFFAIWMQWFHNMTWYPAMLAFIAAAIAYIFDPALASNKVYLLCVILGGFWGVTFLNFFGIKTSAWMSTICVIIGAVLPGLLLIAMGIWWVAQGRPLSMTVTTSDLLPDFEITSFVFLAGIFLALAGLEANANLAREVKDPQKKLPKSDFNCSDFNTFNPHFRIACNRCCDSPLKNQSCIRTFRCISRVFYHVSTRLACSCCLCLHWLRSAWRAQCMGDCRC